MLLQRLGEMLLCLRECAGPPVELLLEVGCSGAATTRNRRLCWALELRRITAARFHCFAARGLAAPPIRVMNGLSPRGHTSSIAGQGRAVHRSKSEPIMSGSGLGRVKTFSCKRSELEEVATRAIFPDFDYALIAAISG